MHRQRCPIMEGWQPRSVSGVRSSRRKNSRGAFPGPRARAGSDALGPVLKARELQALDSRLVNGVITVSASEHRSQLRNREAAASRLAALLTTATAPPPATRRPTRPGRGAKERRLAAKRRRSLVKRMRRPDDE